MITEREESRNNRRALCLALCLAALATTFGTGCNAIFGIDGGKKRPMCADELLIDDMEDGDGEICNLNGRQGPWWTDGDPTSIDLTPGKNVKFLPTRIPSGTRGTSQFAARFSGSGFTSWGAVMGLNLNEEQRAGDRPLRHSGDGGPRSRR